MSEEIKKIELALRTASEQKENDPSLEAEYLYRRGLRFPDIGEWILVAPRRTGRNATFKCSVCGKKVSSYYNDVGEWKCCPHCESKMRGR